VREAPWSAVAPATAFRLGYDLAEGLGLQYHNHRFAAANQFFMNEVYDPEHREAPITDLSSASEEVSVIH